MHATAPVPNRSTSSFVVSFGLINIPVSVYATTVETKVARKEFTADGHAVGRKPYDKETGADVQFGDIVKMVEVGGATVPLSDEEIAEATGHVAGVAPIVGRVSIAELNSDFISERVYQLRPKSDKKAQKASDRAFALLVATLKETDEAALVRVSIRGTVARWGAITPDGYLRIVHSADQVKASLPMPDSAVTDKETELAKALLGAIPMLSVADLRDDSSERVAAYVDDKLAVLAGTGALLTEPTALPAAAVDDIYSQLQASMDALVAKG
jgi:non-homologous end joining protein Ku